MKHKRLILILLCVIVLILSGICAVYGFRDAIFNKDKEEAQTQLSEIPVTEIYTSPSIPPETYEENSEEEAETSDESDESDIKKALTYEERRLNDIYASVGDTVRLYCFNKDALSYEWEIYDSEIKDFVKASDDMTQMTKDDLYRSVSALDIEVMEYNRIVRCIVTTPEKEDIETAHIFPLKGVERVSIDSEININGECYIGACDIPVSVEYSDGSKDIIKGLYGLYFLNEEELQTEEKITATGKRQIKKTVIITESDYKYISLGDTATHLSYNGQELLTVINGIDDEAPVISDVKLDYDIGTENADTEVNIEIDASDKVTPLPDLQYAVAESGKKIADEDFGYSEKLTFTVKGNKEYTAYVKDRSGNIAEYNMNIITVDNKPPQINSVSLTYADGWHTENSIIIDASDGTALKYATSHKGSGDEMEYIETNVINVTENGTYTVYVKDAAGNISQRDITVGNIDRKAPTINGIKVIDKEKSDEN